MPNFLLFSAWSRLSTGWCNAIYDGGAGKEGVLWLGHEMAEPWSAC